MPRIVMLTTGLGAGGAEAQVIRLSAELKRRGWDMTVVSLLPPPRRCEVEALSLGMRPGRPDPGGFFRLAVLLKRLRPQVLHSHMFHANLLARAARLFCPVPVVVTTLHSAAESSRGAAGTRVRDLLYRLSDPLADAVVAVSRAAADRHASCKAVQPWKLRVIPNGVDTGAFRPDGERRERVRRELGVQAGFVWLAAGRLMWKKDYPTLLRAFARLHGSTLLIAGTGPQETQLKRMAAELGGSVRFLGQVDDMPALMNAADGLVMSSVVEGLPVTLLEAAASGLPAVATDAGGTREIVRDVVPLGDAQALAAAMERVASLTAGERGRMAREDRTMVIARFDINAVASQWEATYRELLENAS